MALRRAFRAYRLLTTLKPDKVALPARLPAPDATSSVGLLCTAAINSLTYFSEAHQCLALVPNWRSKYVTLLMSWLDTMRDHVLTRDMSSWALLTPQDQGFYANAVLDAVNRNREFLKDLWAFSAVSDSVTSADRARIARAQRGGSFDAEFDVPTPVWILAETPESWRAEMGSLWWVTAALGPGLTRFRRRYAQTEVEAQSAGFLSLWYR